MYCANLLAYLAYKAKHVTDKNYPEVEKNNEIVIMFTHKSNKYPYNYVKA